MLYHAVSTADVKMHVVKGQRARFSILCFSVSGRGTTFRNCKRMAINGLLEQMCEEEGVGFVDLWGYFVGKEDMFMRDGLHLSGKGAAVFSENLLRSMNNGTGCNFLN